MLPVAEFKVGDLVRVNQPGVTLVMPRKQYELAGIVAVGVDGQRFGIALSGDLPCQAYALSLDEPWYGLLIGDVQIEVDPDSVFDPAECNPQIGAVIRKADRLNITAAFGQHHGMFRRMELTLLTALPPCDPQQAAAFTSWRIIRGTGREAKELIAFDAQEVAKMRQASQQRG